MRLFCCLEFQRRPVNVASRDLARYLKLYEKDCSQWCCALRMGMVAVLRSW